MLKNMGATVTCTLDGTYIVYAKQAGIHYATLQYVLNYGEGLRPKRMPMISETGSRNVAVSMRKTLLDTIAALKWGGSREGQDVRKGCFWSPSRCSPRTY